MGTKPSEANPPAETSEEHGGQTMTLIGVWIVMLGITAAWLWIFLRQLAIT